MQEGDHIRKGFPGYEGPEGDEDEDALLNGGSMAVKAPPKSPYADFAVVASHY